MKKIFKGIAVLAATAAVGTGVAFAAGCGGTDGVYYGEYHYIGAHNAVPYGMVVEVTVKNNIITKVKDITNDKNNEHSVALQTYKDVIDGKEAEEASYHSFTTVSTGWETYFDEQVNAYSPWILSTGKQLVESYVDQSIIVDYDEKAYYYKVFDEKTGEVVKYEKWSKDLWDKGLEVLPEPAQTNIGSYGWYNKNNAGWKDHESWLLQQYVGWSVADILDITVYTNFGYWLTAGAWGPAVGGVDYDSKGEPYGVDYNTELKGSELLISGATQGSGRLLLAVQNALKK